MKTFRTIITVVDTGSIVLNNVPVQSGDQVEVIVRTQRMEESEAAARVKKLMEETQAIPQVESISEEEITQEIAAFRSGQ